MSARINPNQIALPGLESAMCGCGCGQYFMRSTKGRKRLYISNTHKKRRARALATERTGSTRARVQPLGWLYLQTGSVDMANHLWNELSAQEQAVMRVLCESGIPADDLLAGLSGLFARGVRS